MYDNFKVANYDKSLVSPEMFGRPLAKIFNGNVFDGFTVAPGTGMQLVLAPGNGLVHYGSGASASARQVSLLANFNLAVEPADPSNPRIDLVVLYIDNAVSLPSGTPTAANLDGKGVFKAKIVKGTAAAVPAAPNATAIQASVGAGNPYFIAAEARINAGVTTISAGNITDVRPMAMLPAQKIDLATLLAAQQAWQPLAITGGTGTAFYYKDSFGIVRLKGTIYVTGTSVNMFTLPSGYRPATPYERPVSSAGAYGQVIINTNGVVTKQVGANGNLDVSSIFFRADGS